MATVVEVRRVRMTVDLLCHHHYGTTEGTTEAVLAANPGLAALGPHLPLGTRVTMPERAPATPAVVSTALWD